MCSARAATQRLARLERADLAEGAAVAVTLLPAVRDVYFYFGKNEKEKIVAVFAVVNPSGGEVSNIVVADSLEVIFDLVGGAVEVTEATGPGNIGYTWDPETGVFSAPVVADV